MHDMGACDYYENRKNRKTVREVRKIPAVYCMKSCKDCASLKNKPQLGACVKIKNKKNEAKRKRHAEYMRQYRPTVY